MLLRAETGWYTARFNNHRKKLFFEKFEILLCSVENVSNAFSHSSDYANIQVCVSRELLATEVTHFLKLKYRVSKHYRYNPKNSTKFYFLRYVYLVCFVVTGNTSSFF